VTLIVDASVALKWFLSDEPQWVEAKALLDGSEALTAPELIVAEVCNAAWLGVRKKRMSQEQAEALARSLPGLFASLVALSPLAERAVVISRQLDHSVYDCFYLALAEIRGVPLVTADARLLRKLEGTAWATKAIRLVDYRPGR
jgi:predicted nucleic acid-binding protein